ncbi:MAG: hypothetical protein IJT80_05700 [Lachnospiraceae bacterium]|nr:hypothetical protein [Lachnospiraceae bacterium]
MLENSKAISENDLDRVNGGRILNATGMAGCDINNPWEIVDNVTGQTLYKYNCKEAAIVDAVKKWGGSNYDDIRDITQDEVIAKRKAAGIM